MDLLDQVKNSLGVGTFKDLFCKSKKNLFGSTKKCDFCTLTNFLVYPIKELDVIKDCCFSYDLVDSKKYFNYSKPNFG